MSILSFISDLFIYKLGLFIYLPGVDQELDNYDYYKYFINFSEPRANLNTLILPCKLNLIIIKKCFLIFI